MIHNLKKSKKEIRRREKISKRLARIRLKYKNSFWKLEKASKRKLPRITFTSPEDFRIYENYEEVAKYFDNVFLKLLVETAKKTELQIINIEFDFKNVKTTTTDTVIYLLALMKSFKNSSDKSIRFKGGFPSDPICRKIFTESGFLDHLRADSNDFVEKMYEKSGIKYGNGKYFPEKFIPLYEKISPDKKHSRSLSEILVEIVDNSVQHAYSVKNVFKGKEWYFYWTENEKEHSFVVLDTGVGIAKTMKKYFKEKGLALFGIEDEAALLKDALTGGFRTRTGEVNRGQGLPKIYKNCKYGNIIDMEIITGSAYCKITKGEDKLVIRNHRTNFKGTMYRWKIMKEDI